MNLYVETSALLSLVFNEDSDAQIRQFLRSSRFLVSSRLTSAESRRALVRAAKAGRLNESQVRTRTLDLDQMLVGWSMVEVSDSILDRTAQVFPVEPIRTLDAIHLVTAVSVRQRVPDLALLSLDERLRDNGTALGFKVHP